MQKYIIREIEQEACDFSTYFDDDGLTERGGDYCCNLFVVSSDGWGKISGFNIAEYKSVQRCAGEIINAFQNVIGRHSDDDYWTYASHKEAMESFSIPYNSRRCHALKEWAKNADESEPKDIAAFLTITTGKKWDIANVYGYCQGDYVDIVYCPEYYKTGVKPYGEIWLGCGKEFEVICLDENGEESDACGGYIVADSEANSDGDYKRLVCELAGIEESETRLEMIDECRTVRQYTYRIA